MASLWPQHAFRIFSKTTKFKLNHIMRSCPTAHAHVSSYEDNIKKFVDVLFGSHPDNELIKQLAAPINEGGLGIEFYVKQLNDDQYSLSLEICSPAIESILNGNPNPASALTPNHYQIQKRKREFWAKERERIANESDIISAKILRERAYKDVNLWLHTAPLKWKPLWKLKTKDFQDGLRIRYNLEPLGNPSICPALKCSEPLSITHSDSCKYAGLIIRRHDSIKNILARYSEKVLDQERWLWNLI